MSEHLEIVRLGHPVLRQLAEPVPDVLLDSGTLVTLAESLVETMLADSGVGLAAPQVAEPLRLFAYWLPALDGHAGVPPTVLVNPQITAVGEETVEDWEGCLSIPGLRGVVPRAHRVKVKAQLVSGEPISFTADGFHARVVQHEHDHLDGIVYLDRMRHMGSLMFESELERTAAAGEAPTPTKQPSENP
jgi:peptide deformylase